MELEKVIYKAEKIRNGETDVYTVLHLLEENLTAEEISTLTKAATTDSGRFGDVLLAVFTVFFVS